MNQRGIALKVWLVTALLDARMCQRYCDAYPLDQVFVKES